MDEMAGLLDGSRAQDAKTRTFEQGLEAILAS
jgi:hypothetical protein